VERVGVNDSFFELGGDSILSMQVVARARAAGVVFRPRDVFVEQSVAGLARVAMVVDGDDEVVDEGIGPVSATPIIQWLRDFQGLVDEFNQSVLIQAPVGVTEADVVVVLQAVLDRHAMLRLRVSAQDAQAGAGRWSLSVPEPGAVDARTCLHTVDVLTDDAVTKARARLNPAAGAMVSALWVPCDGQLLVIVHHLAVDGVSWRILLEDFNLAWAQHRGGQPVALPAPRTSFARWAQVLVEHAYRPEVVSTAKAWRQIAAVPAALPAVRPEVDTYANAGSLSVELDVETTRMLLGEVPAAFHAGINDILLIAFGLALTEFLGSAGSPVVIDAEGHGRQEELSDGGDVVDLSRTVGWFTTKYPVSLTVGGLDWERVLAGDVNLGPIVKGAKEQLRALPDGVTYGLLRYLNCDVDLAGADPAIGFNYLGRMGAGEVSAELWRVAQDGGALTGVAAAVPMPLAHTVELNAGTVDTVGGPRLRAGWTWALSALDHAQVTRLSGLWFDALAGICAHVRDGGGGLTPSDIAPARLTQHQIDDLRQTHEVADVLPLTPLQQGLLFHANVAHSCGDDVYAVQIGVTLNGRLDRYRLQEAVQAAVQRHPNLVARFCEPAGGQDPRIYFDEPVQVILTDAELPWQYVDVGREAQDRDERMERLCAGERAAVCDLANESPMRAVLIRTGVDEHRLVLTSHHIVLDGWSLPIVLGEVFAGYYRQRLPAPVPFRRFVDWLAERDLDAARDAWREVLAGFDTPTLVGPPDLGLGPRNVTSLRVPEQTTLALNELARTHHTTVSTVLQAAWAQLLMAITGQRDVAFGVVVSGRPAEVAGADAMIGLLINTVPMRARIEPTTTTADLLDQLHKVHNQTLDHEHLGLNEIHRAVGQAKLFDTAFVYENYPIDTAIMSSTDDLTITDVDSRDCYHYPLTIQAVPGPELVLHVQFRTDVFEAASIEILMQRFEQVLEAMTAEPNQPLASIGVWEGQVRKAMPAAESAIASGHCDVADANRPPASEAERIVADIYTRLLGAERVGVDQSFFDLGGDSLSAMRAVAAINAALGTHLAVTNVFDAPTVRSLSRRVRGCAD
jgi:non-ribosomal peptide synthase protein (TIGR01720 family)